jgi:hypothetical protein
MELTLAKTSVTTKTKKITLEQIESKLDKEQFFYFDRENEHKDLLALKEHFEEKGHSVFLKEAKYGLGDLDYIYELHIL